MRGCGAGSLRFVLAACGGVRAGARNRRSEHSRAGHGGGRPGASGGSATESSAAADPSGFASALARPDGTTADPLSASSSSSGPGPPAAAPTGAPTGAPCTTASDDRKTSCATTALTGTTSTTTGTTGTSGRAGPGPRGVPLHPTDADWRCWLGGSFWSARIRTPRVRLTAGRVWLVSRGLADGQRTRFAYWRRAARATRRAYCGAGCTTPAAAEETMPRRVSSCDVVDRPDGGVDRPGRSLPTPACKQPGAGGCYGPVGLSTFTCS